MLYTNMKVVPLAFKFGRSINFVRQNPGNGFFNIFHPFCHFGISHDVDILDERIIFLPKRHFDGSMFSPPPLKIYRQDDLDNMNLKHKKRNNEIFQEYLYLVNNFFHISIQQITTVFFDEITKKNKDLEPEEPKGPVDLECQRETENARCPRHIQYTLVEHKFIHANGAAGSQMGFVGDATQISRNFKLSPLFSPTTPLEFFFNLCLVTSYTFEYLAFQSYTLQ